MISHNTHPQIGSLLFEGLDQIDLTGPFEVLSRIPNATYPIYGKTAQPVRDMMRLRLTPDAGLLQPKTCEVSEGRGRTKFRRLTHFTPFTETIISDLAHKLSH